MPALRIDEDAWKKEQNFIRAMIRFEIDLDLFGVDAAWQNLVKLDPQLQFARGVVSRRRRRCSRPASSRRPRGAPRSARAP